MTRSIVICVCSHHKREHWNTKQQPSGSRLTCPCRSFLPEPVCRCGHGAKAHQKGSCHEGDGCRELRLIETKGDATRGSP
jgi:hypothetical protein